MILRVGFAIALFIAGLTGCGAADEIATLRSGHPRLLVRGPAEWSQIVGLAKADPLLATFLNDNNAEARAIRAAPPPERVLTGRRLLHVSRSVLERVLILGVAYHTGGDRTLAVRAERELLAAAAFSDWNPSHFLDVGEMTAALALGYDWFFDELSPAARATIRRAIIEKGLLPGTDSTSPHNGWQRSENNWNQVCWSGLALGALAIADEEPELAAQVLAQVRNGIASGLKPYAPDGVYPEGPNYWSYGTTYQVLLLAALDSALGTRWQLDASPGFLASAGAQLQLTGPSGHLFNFSDGREPGALQPALFWFAQRLHDPGLLLGQDRYLPPSSAGNDAAREAYIETSRFRPLAALWWPASADFAASPRLPLVWTGDGLNPVAIFRTSWTDPEALYLAVKGGAANLSHAHMDAGSFVLEAGGVRWAIDLGMQPYESLEALGIKLWGRTQDAQRWQVFRLNNRSHNTLTIGDQPHLVAGDARIVEFAAGGAAPHATIDLTPVFAGQAGRALRRFELHDGGTVVVHDSLQGLAAGTLVRWAMATRASVQLADAVALLTQNGRTLQAMLSSACGAHFSTSAGEPPAEYDAPNPGVSFLLVETLVPPSGNLEIEIEFRLVE